MTAIASSVGAWVEERETVGAVVRWSSIVAAYVGLNYLIMRPYGLPEAAYLNQVLILEGLARLAPSGESPIATCGLLLLLAGLAYLLWRGRSTVFGGWDAIEGAAGLRPMILACVGMAAWYFSTYDYNLYFDRGYYFDRGLVVVCAVLSVRRPAFLLPMLIVATALMGQCRHPLGVYNDFPLHLIRFLTLFLAFWLLGCVTKRLAARDFTFVALTMIATAYLKCGLGKWNMDWPTHEHVHYMLTTAYGYGWLAFLEADTIGHMGRMLAKLDPLMMTATLALELGGLLVFWSRRVALVYLSSAVVFHIAVFAVSGICFWQWAILNIFFAAYLASSANRVDGMSFSRSRFALSIVFLLGGQFWFQPRGLGWLDSPANYCYRIVGVDADGREYPMPASHFAPYEFDFSWGFVSAYVKEEILYIYGGAVTSPDLSAELSSIRTPAELIALEARLGRLPYDERRAESIDRFIRRWGAALNRRGGKRRWLTPLQAPMQLWTFAPPGADPITEPLTSVRVYWVTTLFDGEVYREFRKTKVREIDIE